MGETTKIEWCDHTFNPWIGCQHVHAGCTHCYAEAFAKRYGKAAWGPDGTRVRTSPANWRKPLQWNKAAAKAGERRRVFCASLADVFEDWNGVVVDAGGNTVTGSLEYVRSELFALIDKTPHLDWLLLTKRPENIRRMWPLVRRGVEPNVWIGTSVSNQETADKMVPELLKCRDLSPCLFLSCEPILGPINLIQSCPPEWQPHLRDDRISWVIIGGESGIKARPCNVEWIRSLRDQCRDAGVACFIKQLGSWSRLSHVSGFITYLELKDAKGGDLAEWPDDLRVREFPGLAVIR